MTWPPPSDSTSEPDNTERDSTPEGESPPSPPPQPPAAAPPPPPPYVAPPPTYGAPPPPPPTYPGAEPYPGPEQYPPAASYPAGQYAAPGYAVAPAGRTNSMAVISMILSLAGIVTLITAPIGAVLGHMARKQIRESGEEGDGFALTGIIVGWVLTGLAVLGCCVGVIVFFAAAGAGAVS